MNDLANIPVHPAQELDCSGMPRTNMLWGMTLRQHYAGLAMQGLLASMTPDAGRELVARARAAKLKPEQMHAKDSVAFADALLDELAK
jgi:hypothetical protein